MAAKQDWIALDRRGNWLDFREGHSFYSQDQRVRIEHRTRSGVNACTTIDPDGDEDRAGAEDVTGPLGYVSLYQDKAGNLLFNPLAKVAGQSAGECGTAIPGCGPGQEYVYDVANRVVAIHRDTNDAAGPLTGSNPEPKLMEFVYDP